MIFPVSDPVLIFSLIMSLVLLAPLLSRKIRLPSIIGLIASGMLIGPNLTGILDRDPIIEVMGTIGLLYIMFQAGLEINLEQLKKDKHHTIIFGLSTFSIPLLMGTAAGVYLLGLGLVAAILLSSMFSSHTLLTFPIVSRLGLSRKRSVTTAVGGTIVTDTLALLVLAVIIASHHGEVSALFWLRLFLSIGIYSYLTITFLPRIGTWFFRNISSESGVEDYVFVLASMFISGFFSHIAGLEPIIGAFLAGLTLNTLIPEKSLLMNRIQFVGNSLFIPFFLISTGMLINPVLLFTDSYTVKVAMVMIIIAIISKYLAAELFGKLQNYSATERGVIFGMSVNQAAATLAAVIVGYRVGIFDDAILTGTIMMILATSFTGSMFTEKYSKQLIITGKETYDLISTRIHDRILIPISNPKSAHSMMDLAMLLHPKTSPEPLYPLHIAIEGADVEKNIVEGEEILTKASLRANSMQKHTVPIIKIDYNISSGILEAIKEQRISKVILGWNEPASFRHAFFDTVMEQLVKSSNEMIFICRLIKPLNLTKRILLIIPPFINKQYGFIDTLSSVRNLAVSVSAKLTIIAEENTASEINHVFDKAEIVPEYKYIKSWKMIYEDLSKMVLHTDMLMQFVSRPGRIAWRLSFDQMPYKLKQAFPENNILAVFPYYYEKDEVLPELYSEDLSMLNTIPEKNFIINTKESNPEMIFEIVSKSGYFENPEIIKTELMNVLRDYPIELTEDVLLIHVHTKEVSDNQVFPAVNRNGFSVEKIDIRPRIMIILTVPEDQPVQEHLNTLSQISRMVMVKELTDNILIADDYNDFIKGVRESRRSN